MMSCGLASWLPHAVAETLRGHRSAAPLAAWLTGIRAAPEEYDLLPAAPEPAPEPDEPAGFDDILSQLGREIYRLEQYQRNLNPPENEEVSLSILNIFDECLGEIVQARASENANSDNCEPSECENANSELTNGDVEPPVVPVNGNTNEEEDFSDCASTATLSEASFVTSTPAKMVEPCDSKMIANSRPLQPPPVPPRRTRPLSKVDFINTRNDSTESEPVSVDSDRDSVSTCWSYKDCSPGDNDDDTEQYAVVWSHSTGFHNSDEILRKVLSQNAAAVSQVSLDRVSEFEPSDTSVYALPVEGGRCAGAAADVMTADRPADDGYEPVALVADENIYEEIEFSYTDEGCSCGGSIEVESCSDAGRESPVYANLQDHGAYAITADVIAFKNLLLHPDYNEDEEDEWITPEECAVYTQDHQRRPVVIPRIRSRHAVSNHAAHDAHALQATLAAHAARAAHAAHAAHAYHEDGYLGPKNHGYNRFDQSPRSERNVNFASPNIGNDGSPYSFSKRLSGSTENLLSKQARRPGNQLLPGPASSSGDSLDCEVRRSSGLRTRKAQSMVGPSPVRQPAEFTVVAAGPIKRTKYADPAKKWKKNWTDCFMVLTPKALLFYKDQKTYQASIAPKPANAPASTAPPAEMVLPLHLAHISHCVQPHTRRYQRSLMLIVHNHHHFLLQDETEEGAKEWLRKIQNIIYQIGPEPIERQQTPPYQGSSTDAESLGRTPPVSRHNKAKHKGGSSNEDLTESPEGSIPVQKSYVASRLLKFFARRPPMEVLVKKGIYKDEPVFGQNLEAVCPLDSPRVPDFVVEVIREIEASEENMCTDGLYRASGNLSQIQKIRLEIDQKNLSVIKNNPDIHVLTGSLKLFFRELKEPLIPCSMFDRILSACSKKPREARIREFRDIVQALPHCNRDTLKFVLEHLLRVTQYSEHNRMHTANLAIVFGPTLLWAPAAQAHNIAVDCIQQNNVVDILLTDFKEIFQDDKTKKKA